MDFEEKTLCCLQSTAMSKSDTLATHNPMWDSTSGDSARSGGGSSKNLRSSGSQTDSLDSPGPSPPKSLRNHDHDKVLSFVSFCLKESCLLLNVHLSRRLLCCVMRIQKAASVDFFFLSQVFFMFEVFFSVHGILSVCFDERIVGKKNVLKHVLCLTSLPRVCHGSMFVLTICMPSDLYRYATACQF